MGRLRVWGPVTEERAVSSTVSVVLLIAIAVILASIISVFAFDAFDRHTEEAPQVIFEYDYDSGANTLTITHKTGDTPEGFTMNFRKKDGTDMGDWSGETEVEPGDSITLTSISSSDAVLIVWEQPRPNEDTAIIGTWEGPDA